jgi:hypothetical protein
MSGKIRQRRERIIRPGMAPRAVGGEGTCEWIQTLRARHHVRSLATLCDGPGPGDPFLHLDLAGLGFPREIDLAEESLVIPVALVDKGSVEMGDRDRSDRPPGLPCHPGPDREVVMMPGLHSRRRLHLDHPPAPRPRRARRQHRVDEDDDPVRRHSRPEDRPFPGRERLRAAPHRLLHSGPRPVDHRSPSVGVVEPPSHLEDLPPQGRVLQRRPPRTPRPVHATPVAQFGAMQFQPEPLRTLPPGEDIGSGEGHGERFPREPVRATIR